MDNDNPRRTVREAPAERLPLGRIVAYSLPAAPMIFMTYLVNLYLLKFTTDVLLIAPATFGALFAGARVWDAVSDPIVGYWSDRTRSEFGRRRPWILAASIPMALAFAAVWSPPAIEGRSLEVWMALAIFAYYTASSAAYIPHLALGAELTLDYHERSRLATGRGLFELIGMLLAAAAIGYMSSVSPPRAAGTHLSLFFGLATVGLLGTHVSLLRERTTFQGRGASRPGWAARDVMRNPHARVLLFVFFVDMLSVGFLAVLFPFMADQLAEGMNPGLAMVAVMGIAMLSVPLWLRLARRFGKRTPWMFGLGLKAVGFATLFLLDRGPTPVAFLPILLIGTGQACTSILPNSIKADVIDYDELETGERKEGAYFAAWNLVIKLASAVAIAASAFLLEWAGYRPEVDAQSPETLTAITRLTALIPVALHAVAMVALSRFRLSPIEHNRIRREIALSRPPHQGEKI